MTRVGIMVESIRTINDWSQVELGKGLGKSESWVSQVERGARSVDSIPTLMHMAEVLGIDPMKLIKAAVRDVQDRRVKVADAFTE